MITNTALLKFSEHQNILAAGIKMLALCKLSLRAGRCKREDDGVVTFIQNSVEEGDTVIDIGSQECGIYFMRKKLRQSGKIVAFEWRPYLYQHLFQLKKILNWKNVKVEFTRLSNVTGAAGVYNSQNTRYNGTSQGAIVIKMSRYINSYDGDNIIMQTLDNYCALENIQPRFIKIDANGNELKILKGAFNVLKIYKPKILLKCEERIAGSDNVLETFKLLQKLNYTGYFVLDTIRIPLVNFDFNVYQNPCKNFYCSHFMFE